jgi:hypothetical protein
MTATGPGYKAVKAAGEFLLRERATLEGKEPEFYVQLCSIAEGQGAVRVRFGRPPARALAADDRPAAEPHVSDRGLCSRCQLAIDHHRNARGKTICGPCEEKVAALAAELTKDVPHPATLLGKPADHRKA